MRILFFLVAAITFAKDPIKWEIGRVLDQQMGSQQSGAYAAPIGTAVIAVPIYATTNVVVIEAGEYIYQWAEQGRSPLLLPVNDQIQFYRDKDKFIILDSKNKKHNFVAIGMRRK